MTLYVVLGQSGWQGEIVGVIGVYSSVPDAVTAIRSCPPQLTHDVYDIYLFALDGPAIKSPPVCSVSHDGTILPTRS